MCGAPLEIASGLSVVECEYCGTQQTLPKLDDDKRVMLYDRANQFRRNNEFDKAADIYDQILTEDGSDAEAYWSLVLCKYGIEYVEDPVAHKRIPTVNRTQYTSIFDDINYKSALRYADPFQKRIYEEEANTINEIQKGILAISQKEDPFDVFICYKETDTNGRRTMDSVLAQELYFQLKQEGFKVFFSRITLEDKLGSAYEPYIFAALNSAKVMVVLGTRPEHFNAVWVKNEWSRYLSLIKQGQKKILIPAYRDMDPYNLPVEFSHLQAQDMSKLGFMQDLIRGIKKLAKAEEPKPTVIKETVVTQGAAVNANAAPLLRRAFMFLEDGNWRDADEYCEKVLDIDPENAKAYLGKLMAQLRVRNQDDLKNRPEPFDNNSYYQKVMRFGNDALKTTMSEYIEYIKERNKNNLVDKKYQKAVSIMQNAKSISDYNNAFNILSEIVGYRDTEALINICKQKMGNIQLEGTYCHGVSIMRNARNSGDYQRARDVFMSISGYKNSDELAQVCYNQGLLIPSENAYQRGVNLFKSADNEDDLEAAANAFSSIRDYKNANELANLCLYGIDNMREQRRSLRIRHIVLLAILFVGTVVINAIAAAIGSSMDYGYPFSSLLSQNILIGSIFNFLPAVFALVAFIIVIATRKSVWKIFKTISKVCAIISLAISAFLAFVALATYTPDMLSCFGSLMFVDILMLIILGLIKQPHVPRSLPTSDMQYGQNY